MWVYTTSEKFCRDSHRKKIYIKNESLTNLTRSIQIIYKEKDKAFLKNHKSSLEPMER